MVAGAVPGGDPRQRGTILGSRIEDEDARRPGHGRVEMVGSAATPREARAASIVDASWRMSWRPGYTRYRSPGRACPRSPAQPGPAWRAPPARPRRPLSARAGPPGSGFGAGAADAVRPARRRHSRRALPRHRAAVAHGVAGRSGSPSRAGTSAAAPRAQDRAAWRRSAAPRRSAAHRPRCGTPHRPLHRARHAMPPRSTRHSAGTGRPSARPSAADGSAAAAGDRSPRGC